MACGLLDVLGMSAEPRHPRILVATDLSDPGAEAVRQADAYARRVSGTLGVCHVLPSLGIHMLFPQRYASEASGESELETRARAFVTESVARVTGRASFEVFVERGTAYAEIVRCAEAWRATVIFVGSRGPTGSAGGRLGGVAEKVVQIAHCPVIIARPASRPGLVICATDLSEPSLPAIEAAVVEARLRGAKLVVLHVIDQGAPLASVGPSEGITPLVLSPELLGDLRASARAQIEAVLTKLDAPAEIAIIDGHAAPTILACLEDRQPELAVVGARGRTRLARIILGSVAESVVREASTSVLVVRLPS
jgi:nucleotide-binding universal stress UspA family protein